MRERAGGCGSVPAPGLACAAAAASLACSLAALALMRCVRGSPPAGASTASSVSARRAGRRGPKVRPRGGSGLLRCSPDAAVHGTRLAPASLRHPAKRTRLPCLPCPRQAQAATSGHARSLRGGRGTPPATAASSSGSARRQRRSPTAAAARAAAAAAAAAAASASRPEPQPAPLACLNSWRYCTVACERGKGCGSAGGWAIQGRGQGAVQGLKSRGQCRRGAA